MIKNGRSYWIFFSEKSPSLSHKRFSEKMLDKQIILVYMNICSYSQTEIHGYR